FVERERNLLLGFETNDVSDFLFFDGREFDKPGQAALTGDADGDDIATEDVSGQELFQRFAGQLIRGGIGLTEDLGVFDIVERGGRDLVIDQGQTDGLESTLANVYPPNSGLF